MKTWKRIFTVLLAAALCVATAACGDTENSSSSTSAGSGASSDSSAETQEQNTGEGQEYDQIVYALWTGNRLPDDCSDVEEAINQITREEIVQAANKVSLDTVYFLTGKEAE